MMTAPSPSPSLPAFVKPMLASSGSAFDDDNYLFEIKWDGIRMLAFLEAVSYAATTGTGQTAQPLDDASTGTSTGQATRHPDAATTGTGQAVRHPDAATTGTGQAVRHPDNATTGTGTGQTGTGQTVQPLADRATGTGSTGKPPKAFMCKGYWCYSFIVPVLFLGYLIGGYLTFGVSWFRVPVSRRTLPKLEATS